MFELRPFGCHRNVNKQSDHLAGHRKFSLHLSIQNLRIFCRISTRVSNGISKSINRQDLSWKMNATKRSQCWTLYRQADIVIDNVDSTWSSTWSSTLQIQWTRRQKANVKLIADDLSVDSTFVNCNNLFIKKNYKEINEANAGTPTHAHYENLFLFFIWFLLLFMCLRSADHRPGCANPADSQSPDNCWSRLLARDSRRETLQFECSHWALGGKLH